jgi:hypothetical protein
MKAACFYMMDAYGTTGAIARILPVSLSSTTVMSSLRVEGVKSGGRKPTLDSSRALVVRNAFSFSAAAGFVFWICVRGLAAVAASLALES